MNWLIIVIFVISNCVMGFLRIKLKITMNTMAYLMRIEKSSEQKKFKSIESAMAKLSKKKMRAIISDDEGGKAQRERVMIDGK